MNEILIPSNNGYLSILEIEDSYQLIYYLMKNDSLILEDILLVKKEELVKIYKKLEIEGYSSGRRG